MAIYEVLRRMPGETMTVLAPAVGATVRDLHRPMRAGRTFVFHGAKRVFAMGRVARWMHTMNRSRDGHARVDVRALDRLCQFRDGE
jgi:hypothetical protein